MDPQVSIEVDGLTDFHSLYRWLRSNHVLAGLVHAIHNRPGEGELGGAWNTISVAVGSGGAVTALAQSLKTYFAQASNRRFTVRIKITDGAGESVELDAEGIGAGQLESVVESLASRLSKE